MEQLLENGVAPADINQISITDTAGIVSVKLSDTQSAEFKYTLPLSTKFNPKNARIFLLEKQNVLENSVYEIYFDNRQDTGGYIFPLRLLISNESEFTPNARSTQYTPDQVIRFQNSALAAFCHIAKALYLTGKTENTERTISIIDEYGEDAVVLMLTTDTNRAPENFELIRYLPSLFQYGYLYKDKPKSKNSHNTAPFKNCETRSIKLNSVSSDFPNIEFIADVFCEMFPKNWSPITSFFLCYQIIELCIEEIRLSNGRIFVQNISGSISDAVKSGKIIRDYQQNTGEIQRINKLFSEHLPNANYSGMLLEGQALISELGSSTTSEPEILYSLRNYFFHAFHLVQKNCHDPNRLINVSWEVFILTLEILICYKKHEDLPQQTHHLPNHQFLENRELMGSASPPITEKQPWVIPPLLA